MTFTVADGTNTNSYVPVYGLWVDSYTRTQMIYPEDLLLTEIKSGTIESIKFFSSTASKSWGAASFNVSLSTTTETSLTSGYVAVGTTAYSGTVSVSGNEMLITLSTPFNYTGGNLVIDFSQQVTGTYGSCSFYGINNFAAGSGRYGYNAGGAASVSGTAITFLPKMEISGTFIPSCKKPLTPTIDDQTANSLTVSWTPNPLNTSPLGYMLTATVGTTVYNGWATGSTYTFTGLNPATTYTVEIATRCSATDQSGNVNIMGTTGCPSSTNPMVMPAAFGFEADALNAVPTCWTIVNGEVKVNTTSSNAHGNTNSLQFTTTNDSNVIAMPLMTIPAHGVEFDLWAKASSQNVTGLNSRIEIGYVTSLTNPATFVAVDSVMNTTSSYQHLHTYYRNVPAGAYIAIRNIKNTRTNSWYVDDIAISAMPHFMPVTNLTLSNPTDNGFTANWDPNQYNPATTQYQVVAALVDSLPDWENAFVTTDTFYTFTTLDAYTEYDVYVRATAAGTSDVSVYDSNRAFTAITCGTPANDDEHYVFKQFEIGYTSATSTTPFCNMTTAGYDTAASWQLFTIEELRANGVYYNVFGTPYLADQMINSYGGKISGIAWNHTNATKDTVAFRMYAVETSKSTLTDTIDHNTMTLVFADTMVFNPGWNEIRFNAPFEFNGDSNIVFAMFRDTILTQRNVNFAAAATGSSIVRYGNTLQNVYGYSRNYTRFTICDNEPNAYPVSINGYIDSTLTDTSVVVEWFPSNAQDPYREAKYQVLAVAEGTTLDWANAIDVDTATAMVFDSNYMTYVVRTEITLNPYTDYYVYVRSNHGDTCFSDSARIFLMSMPGCDSVGHVFTIGTPAYTPSYNADYAPYIGREAAFGASWQLFTRSEIMAAKEHVYDADIKGIAWGFTGDTIDAQAGIQIYMANTSKTTLTDTIDRNTMTLVFDSVMTFRPMEFSEMRFPTPFKYNSDSNLVIMVYRNGGTFTHANMSFATETATGKSIFRYGTSNTNPLGNLLTNAYRTVTRFSFCDSLPSCYPVESAIVTDLIGTRPHVQWDAPIYLPANGYLVAYDTVNYVDSALAHGNVVAAADTHTFLNGLEASTLYYAWIAASCSATDTSRWFPVDPFMTGCETKTLPYTTGFENDSAAATPDCWLVLNGGAYAVGPSHNSLTNGTVQTGRRAMMLYMNSTSQDNVVLLPTVDAEINTTQLTFSFRPANDYYAGKLSIGYVTDPTDASTFVTLDSVDKTTSDVRFTTNDYQTISVSYKNRAPEGAYMALKYRQGESNYSYYASEYGIPGGSTSYDDDPLYIDNVTIDVAPAANYQTDYLHACIDANDPTFYWRGIEIDLSNYVDTTDGAVYSQTTQGMLAGVEYTFLLRLLVHQNVVTYDTQMACESYTWIDGNTYTADTMTARFVTAPSVLAHGCDSVSVLNLDIKVPARYVVNKDTCASDYTWTAPGYLTYNYAASVNPAVVIYDTMHCDSTIFKLTLRAPIDTVYFFDTICAGETYTYGGNTYTESFDSVPFSVKSLRWASCDSITVVSLLVRDTTFIDDTIYGYGTYTYTGSFTQTFNNNTSADTLYFTIIDTVNAEAPTCIQAIRHTLVLRPNGVYDFYVTSNEKPYTWTLAGTTVSQTFVNTEDSMAVRTLMVGGSLGNTYRIHYKYVADTLACDNQTRDLTYYTANGAATHTSTAFVNDGATAVWVNYDTIIDEFYHLHYNMKVQPTVIVNPMQVNACASWEWKGQTYTAATSFWDTIQSTVNGCDSVNFINLFIGTPITDTAVTSANAAITYTACDSTWNGQKWTKKQNKYMTFVSESGVHAGCDSVAYVKLRLRGNVKVTADSVVCGTVTWNYTTPVMVGGIPQFTATKNNSYVKWPTTDSTLHIVDTVVGAAPGGCDSIFDFDFVVRGIVNDDIVDTSYTGMWHDPISGVNITIPVGDTLVSDSLISHDLTLADNGACGQVRFHVTILQPLVLTDVYRGHCGTFTWFRNNTTYWSVQDGDANAPAGARFLSFEGANGDSVVYYTATTLPSITEMPSVDSITNPGVYDTLNGGYAVTWILDLLLNPAVIIDTVVDNWPISLATDQANSYTFAVAGHPELDSTYTGIDTTKLYTMAYVDTNILNPTACATMYRINLNVVNDTIYDTAFVCAYDTMFVWKHYLPNGNVERNVNSHVSLAANFMDGLGISSMNFETNDTVFLPELVEDYAVNVDTIKNSNSMNFTEKVNAGTKNQKIYAMKLYRMPNAFVSTIVKACDAYTWNGQTYDKSGAYNIPSDTLYHVYDNGRPALNCELNTMLLLTVNEAITDTAVADHFYWDVNDSIYYTSTQDTVISTTEVFTDSELQNCAKKYLLNLVVNPSVIKYVDTVYSKDTTTTHFWYADGTAYAAATNMTYWDSLVSENEDMDIYFHNDTIAGTATSATNGLDSIYRTVLRYQHFVKMPYIDTICENDAFTYTKWGVTVSKAHPKDTAYFYVNQPTVRDTMVPMSLTFQYVNTVFDTQFVSEPYVWVVNGDTIYPTMDSTKVGIDSTGVYHYTYQTSPKACPTHVILDLTYFAPVDTNIYVRNSELPIWYIDTVNGIDSTELDSAGTYMLYWSDSIRHTNVNLFVLDTQYITMNDTVCFNTTVTFDADSVYNRFSPNTQFSVPTEFSNIVFADTTTFNFNVAGTDTLVINAFMVDANGILNDLVLTVAMTTLDTHNIYFRIAEGCSYYWEYDEVTYYEDTTVTYNSYDPYMCPNTVNLVLDVTDRGHVEYNILTCAPSYTWAVDSVTYTVNGTYTVVDTLENGCVRDNVLNLVVNSDTVFVTDTFATACGSFDWHGVSYTASGNYTFNGTTAEGCTTVDTLHLTINQTTATTIDTTVCGSYSWDGQIFTASTVETRTYTAANGCDSTVTLNLTVLQPVVVDLTVTACGSYTWNGETYTTSGIVRDTVQVNGCDSITNLVLIINQGYNTNLVATACDSYTWEANNTTYTTSGTYTHNMTTLAGCDSTLTLTLTVNNSQATTITATACDSYDWNGGSYTTTGNYTMNYTGANGCDSTVTLNLTVNNSVKPTVDVRACDNYNWNGQTYTVSGIYVSDTMAAANGCDSIVTLVLTINPSITVVQTATAETSYEWNGQTYTTSGSYEVTVPSNVTGCDSTTILNLTITGQPQVYYTVDVTVYNQNTNMPDTNVGYVHGAGTYPADTVVTLTAMAKPGYVFVTWSNDLRTPTIQLTLTNNVSLRAYFRPEVGIDDVNGDNVTIYSADSKIIVKGAENRDINVYDVNGRCVQTQVNAAETVEFQMSNTGVYLVKVGDAPAKRVLVVK